MGTTKQWHQSKFPGVRFRHHKSRKHGIQLDKYFTVRYQRDGKRVEEPLGWASEGWTEQKAALELAKLKSAATTGQGPARLSEKRLIKKREIARIEAEGLTLADFWENDYLHHLKNRLPKESSRQKEIGHFEKRIMPAMGHKPLKEIVPEDAERMLDRMQADGLTPRTQQYALGTLYRIWKHAARRKLVKAGDNPAAGLHVEKINNTRTREIRPQELKEILEYLRATNTNAYNITLFCTFTGCRFSEAAKLTWEHVDIGRGTALFIDTKKNEVREVYLVPELLSMLDVIGMGGAGEYVFKQKNETPFKEPPRTFKTAVDNLELNKNRGPRDRITFHSLRHTAATLAARRDTPVKDMQVLFGWKTPSMVFRYAKGNEDVQRRAMQGLAQSLTAEPGKVVPMVKTGS